MAKQHYSVRASIDRSFMDQELVLSPGGALSHPIAIKVIFFYLGSALLTVWACAKTFIADSPIVMVAFIVWMLTFTTYMGRYSKTKELTIERARALLGWLPKTMREVSTRRTDKPNDFYSIVGIESIGTTGVEDGAIRWADGTVGRAYQVVGLASNLLFEEDKEAILDRVAAFWRKAPDTGVEFIFLTTKEPQRVERQVTNIDRRKANLVSTSSELQALLDQDRSTLVEHVGMKLNSIHQYLVLKCNNTEALDKGEVLLRSELQNGARLMFKQCTPLDGKAATNMFSVFYRGR